MRRIVCGVVSSCDVCYKLVKGSHGRLTVLLLIGCVTWMNQGFVSPRAEKEWIG